MNKLILFACLFVAITSQCMMMNATKLDDCKKNLTEGEKEGGNDACCFAVTNNSKSCAPFVKKNVPELVKNGTKNDSTFSIDCNSNWISFSFYLVALLFMI